MVPGSDAATAGPVSDQTRSVSAPTISLLALNKFAEAARRAEPKLTKEQAFAKVYCDPSNRELVQAKKAERRVGA